MQSDVGRCFGLTAAPDAARSTGHPLTRPAKPLVAPLLKVDRRANQRVEGRWFFIDDQRS